MRTEYNNNPAMDPSGFVLLSDYVPGIIQEIRYFSTYNFIGDRIDGYEEPCAILSVEAARALKTVYNELFVQGYRIKVFDAYRPACAVKHFVLWGIEDQDIKMKPYFYPDLEKQELFAKGYIAKQSSHSRGSTVDLTLFDMKTGKGAGFYTVGVLWGFREREELEENGADIIVSHPSEILKLI